MLIEDTDLGMSIDIIGLGHQSTGSSYRTEIQGEKRWALRVILDKIYSG